MREEKVTADRMAAYSDAVFAVIVTIMVLELKAPDQSAFSDLWPLWPTAISYAVSYLFIAIIWINHHYLMRFVGHLTLRLMWINFVHLFMVSLLPFATACAHPTRVVPCSVLRRALRVRRHCLQRLRVPSIGPRGRQATVRAYPAYGEAPVPRCACELYDRYAGCVRRAARRLRSDLRCPNPPPAARCLSQSPVIESASELESPLGFTNR